MKKIGLKNFEKEILEIFESDEELLYAEIKYLVKDDNILNPLCYNRSLPRLYFKDGKVTVSKCKESLLEIDKIIEDYKDNLLTHKELVKKYRISPSTLYNIIESFDVKAKGKRFDQKIMDEIKKYHYEGLNNREIGEIVGLPGEYVRYYLNNKLNIDTKERDFRKERKLGLGAKPVIHKETGIIYERGAKGASESLNIPVSQITKSLKTNQIVNGNTFIYS